MHTIKLGLSALAWVLLGSAGYAQGGPCGPACDALYKNGCPANHCNGIVEGNVCHAFCSSTFRVPDVVQFYSNGKLMTLVPQSVRPKESPK
jgi:F0F1-type ATP synthase membrane subunit c/vacuolar-type H+-ATPase subunit K